MMVVEEKENQEVATIVVKYYIMRHTKRHWLDQAIKAFLKWMTLKR